MNRLWVRLSIAFSSVVMIAVIILLGVSVLLAQLDALQAPIFESLRVPGGVIDQLSLYYQTHQSWQGVNVFLAGVESGLPLEGRLAFALQDTDSDTIYSARSVSSAVQLGSIPVQVKEQDRGILNVYRVTGLPTTNQQRYFLGRLRDFLLLVALVGGAVGLIFGIRVSRLLAAPLSRLEEAALAIGAGQLSERLQVSGSREIAAVGHAFNKMAEALQEAEVLRRNLVADVAHELRTPLSVLQGNLLAILDGVYPLDNTEIARLYEQTHLLKRLVNDLHELTLAEARQLPLHMQPTDVGRHLTNVIAAFSPTADTAAVELNLDVAPHMPLVLLDPLRLTEVVDNLLSNAIRHTPAGGKIWLYVGVENGSLQLVVKDSGEGIAPEHLRHVFDRFYRTDRSRSRAAGGSGLGLAIVRAIVEMHNGTVTATSDGISGHGSTFTVQIPAKH